MLPDTNTMIAALKAQNAPQLKRTTTGKKTYTITQEWLDKHDEQVRKQVLERKHDELKAYAHAIIKEDMDKTNELFIGEHGEVLKELFILTVSIPLKVLVRDFGWKPIRRFQKNLKISRFAFAIEDEVNKIALDNFQNVADYATKVFEEIGLEFQSVKIDDES